MIVGIKDIFKMIGIMIISCCAVWVCGLFLNYNMDLLEIEHLVEAGQMQVMYDAVKMTGIVVCGVSGGCLLITSVVMLIFYIKNYIDTHGKELGILKALGYSNFNIASRFWVFGLSVFVGTSVGFLGAFAMMPKFYEVQGKDKFLPEVTLHFHPELVVYLILLPTLFFAGVAVLFALLKLNMPVLQLLKGKVETRVKKAKKDTDLPFLMELKKGTLRQKKTLVFFMGFATFCYAAMMQMSFSMDELASVMMAVMTLAIGILLACVTLFLAATTVINSNMKTIAMMKVFGYSLKDCNTAILSGYRPVAYIGFAIGTMYQFVLLKVTVSVVFKDVENIPEYNFDVQAFIITLISFAVLYELIMYFYVRRIKKITIKEIMSGAE